jgi:ankyrin repeat protein
MYLCTVSIGDDLSRMEIISPTSPSRSEFAQELSAAIRAGDTQLVTNIVTKVSSQTIVHYRDSSPQRRSFLHLACEMNACAIVKIFLAIGMPVDITDGRNRTCLHTAETAEMVSSLCESGARCHLVDAAGYTPLHMYVCN